MASSEITFTTDVEQRILSQVHESVSEIKDYNTALKSQLIKLQNSHVQEDQNFLKEIFNKKHISQDNNIALVLEIQKKIDVYDSFLEYLESHSKAKVAALLTYVQLLAQQPLLLSGSSEMNVLYQQDKFVWDTIINSLQDLKVEDIDYFQKLFLIKNHVDKGPELKVDCDGEFNKYANENLINCSIPLYQGLVRFNQGREVFDYIKEKFSKEYDDFSSKSESLRDRYLGFVREFNLEVKAQAEGRRGRTEIDVLETILKLYEPFLEKFSSIKQESNARHSSFYSLLDKAYKLKFRAEYREALEKFGNEKENMESSQKELTEKLNLFFKENLKNEMVKKNLLELTAKVQAVKSSIGSFVSQLSLDNISAFCKDKDGVLVFVEAESFHKKLEGEVFEINQALQSLNTDFTELQHMTKERAELEKKIFKNENKIFENENKIRMAKRKLEGIEATLKIQNRELEWKESVRKNRIAKKLAKEVDTSSSSSVNIAKEEDNNFILNNISENKLLILQNLLTQKDNVTFENLKNTMEVLNVKLSSNGGSHYRLLSEDKSTYFISHGNSSPSEPPKRVAGTAVKEHGSSHARSLCRLNKEIIAKFLRKIGITESVVAASLKEKEEARFSRNRNGRQIIFKPSYM